LKLSISQQAKEREAAMDDVIMNNIDMESNGDSLQMINGASKDHTVRYMFATIPEIHFV